MSLEPVGAQVRANTNRKVYVVNMYSKPHVEDFRGKLITVPPNGEKSFLMPYLAAERFIGQMWPYAKPKPNGEYRPGEAPKALKIIELSDAEKEKIEGKSPEQLKKMREEEEAALRLTCQQCGFHAATETGLKIHISRNHPDSGFVEPTPRVKEFPPGAKDELRKAIG